MKKMTKSAYEALLKIARKHNDIGMEERTKKAYKECWESIHKEEVKQA